MMRPKSERSRAHTEELADNLERTARFVYPDFRATPDGANRAVDIPAPAVNLGATLAQHPLQPPYPDSSMFFGLGASPSTGTMSPSAILNPEDVEQHAGLTPADSAWNFDLATADMEAFLSIDPNLDTYQFPTYP